MEVVGGPLLVKAEGVWCLHHFAVEMSYAVALLTGIKHRNVLGVWKLISKRDCGSASDVCPV